jgi:hypothetical protein
MQIMNFTPGQDRITEEVVELFGLVNARYVSIGQGHLETRRYLSKALEGQAERLIIEKLLSIAIKIRFLDDKNRLLTKHDRANAGLLTENSTSLDSQPKDIGMREALNKIIHAESIEIKVQQTNIRVENKSCTLSEEELLVKEGRYLGFSIFIRTEGAHQKKPWVFKTELTHMINEILRVLYFQNIEIPR